MEDRGTCFDCAYYRERKDIELIITRERERIRRTMNRLRQELGQFNNNAVYDDGYLTALDDVVALLTDEPKKQYPTKCIIWIFSGFVLGVMIGCCLMIGNKREDNK